MRANQQELGRLLLDILLVKINKCYVSVPRLVEIGTLIHGKHSR